jgi:hypothetical protein
MQQKQPPCCQAIVENAALLWLSSPEALGINLKYTVCTILYTLPPALKVLDEGRIGGGGGCSRGGVGFKPSLTPKSTVRGSSSIDALERSKHIPIPGATKYLTHQGGRNYMKQSPHILHFIEGRENRNEEFIKKQTHETTEKGIGEGGRINEGM